MKLIAPIWFSISLVYLLLHLYLELNDKIKDKGEFLHVRPPICLYFSQLKYYISCSWHLIKTLKLQSPACAYLIAHSSLIYTPQLVKCTFLITIRSTYWRSLYDQSIGEWLIPLELLLFLSKQSKRTWSKIGSRQIRMNNSSKSDIFPIKSLPSFNGQRHIPAHGTFAYSIGVTVSRSFSSAAYGTSSMKSIRWLIAA